MIDTEGKPVAGATVKVTTVFAPAEGKLDAFLAGWKNDWKTPCGCWTTACTCRWSRSTGRAKRTRTASSP